MNHFSPVDGVGTRAMLVRAREPFRREGARGVRITLQVPRDLLHFIGHFPGDPILPAIAQLELIVLDEIALCWPELGSPCELQRLKWKAPIRPGDELQLELVRNGAKPRVDFAIVRGSDACGQGVILFEAAL
jgi:3-hydroxymyristoyl/3-hydroxydecanoyl-(acyl carrier protein) dehydratase